MDINGEDTSDCFYANIDELKDSVDRIVAATLDVEVKDDNAYITVKSLQNDDIIPEYRILVSINKGEYQALTEYSSETEYVFNVSDYSNYRFRVEVRQSGENEYDTFCNSKKIK